MSNIEKRTIPETINLLDKYLNSNVCLTLYDNILGTTYPFKGKLIDINEEGIKLANFPKPFPFISDCKTIKSVSRDNVVIYFNPNFANVPKLNRDEQANNITPEDLVSIKMFERFGEQAAYDNLARYYVKINFDLLRYRNTLLENGLSPKPEALDSATSKLQTAVGKRIKIVVYDGTSNTSYVTYKILKFVEPGCLHFYNADKDESLSLIGDGKAVKSVTLLDRVIYKNFRLSNNKELPSWHKLDTFDKTLMAISEQFGIVLALNLLKTYYQYHRSILDQYINGEKEKEGQMAM